MLTFLPPPPSEETVAEHIMKLIGRGRTMTVAEIKEVAALSVPPKNVIEFPAPDNRRAALARKEEE